MNGRLLVLGTLAGALTLFAWETASNTVIPWHTPTMKAFADSDAVAGMLRSQAPENGMYVDVRGIVAAVAFLPDMRSRESLMGLLLARQLALDLVVAFVVVFLFTRLPRLRTSQYAMVTAALAFAVASSAFASDWNWYGFGTGWTVVNILDRTVGYALLGLAVGAVLNRFSVKGTTDEWNGMRAHARMPSSRSTPSSGARL